MSKRPGLEIKNGERWIKAQSKPGLRVYVNAGDWLLFQTGRSDFKAGLHRVPEIAKERVSMALFLNPPYSEEQNTPKVGKVPYQAFLFSDKTPFK